MTRAREEQIIEAAYKEAKARGLPDGWTCTIDKRKRRKWTAPNNGKSCDSIPKALTISVDLGLLPPDTVIPTGHKKKKRSAQQQQQQQPKKKKLKKAATTTDNDNEDDAAAASLLSMGGGSVSVGTNSALLDSASSKLATTVPSANKKSQPQHDELESSDDEDDEEQEEEDLGPPPLPMDPETTIDVHWDLLSTVSASESSTAPRPLTRQEATLPNTVHWDPNSPDGRKIGWKVKIEHPQDGSWLEGRIVRYDPHTHKHKIQFTDDPTSSSSSSSCWIWLRNEQHNLQLATRLVWAHVKGYAWWPALVMESNVEASKTKEGYVSLEFFGTGEVSCLRDRPDTVRPLDPYSSLDAVVARHKKKRNQRAYQLAVQEYHAVRRTRQAAAVYYAKAALHMANFSAPTSLSASTTSTSSSVNSSLKNLIGQRVQIHRSDVNYPYGDTCIGTVRQYSPLQKKWLVSFEISERQSQRTKYPPAWINLLQKDFQLTILHQDNSKSNSSSGKASNNKVSTKTISNEALIPYLFGFDPDDDGDDDETEEGDDNDDTKNMNTKAISSDPNTAEISELLNTRCRGCVEYLRLATVSSTSSSSGDKHKSGGPQQQQPTVTCATCQGTFHLGCVDPPLTTEQWTRLLRDGTPFVCARCVPCRGCFGPHDVCFGSHLYAPTPPTLSLPDGASLHLCFACRGHYDAKRFCPNCAHSWDDKKFNMVRRQIEHGTSSSMSSINRGRKKSKTGSNDACLFEDTASPLYFGSFEGDENLPFEVPVDPCLFYPETSEWGYTEDEMLVCDNCDVWVHAGCSGMTEDEYEVTSDGDHPIYSKEYLCRVCCRQRCKEIIGELQREDRTLLFALPVSEKIVPNYRDIIKEPMDLHTMLEKTDSEYLNYAWVREMFELMVLNALTFNRYYTDVWREAERFYHTALKTVFGNIGKAAPPSKYQKDIVKCFDRAEEARKNEEERVQVDESVEKKDLVAGTIAATVELQKFLDAPPDQPSCVPYTEVKMKAVDAFYCSWMDCCFTCGSSGASDTFLFCVDCGEAFHSFCVSAPVHSMELSSVAGWRCPNCKICEISGDVPPDETRMLFCEMCDRGFSLDLLDPPLTSAPSGLWICGQCVCCKECGNTSEKEGASLRYWSQVPEKCFRCGGCGNLVKNSIHGKCQVCAGLLREDDQDTVECFECRSRVHTSCDERAGDYLCLEATATRTQKAQKDPDIKYLCPKCFEPAKNLVQTDSEGDSIKPDRKYLADQAKLLVEEGTLGSHDPDRIGEIYQVLVEQVDWMTRDQYRDEYLSIISDALRIYCMAQTVGDPRFVIQQVLQRMHQLPPWLGHRALRFAVLTKQKQWDINGFDHDSIEVVVITAKLASAFIDIVCRTLGIDKEKDVSCFSRLENLVRAPNSVGEYYAPFDPIRPGDDTAFTSGLVFKIGDDRKAASKQVSVFPKSPAAKTSYKVASPLCGWASEVRNPSGLTEWRDPRECCLCHICGDDDAGFPELLDDEPEREYSPLGRLLPMSDGYWVHTSCALWSSEVWEASDDGLIHAVEKARGRGAQLKCFGCGRSGATVGCNKGNCPYNYHFPCAKLCGCVFSTNQQVFCANHKSSALSTMAKESSEHMKALLVAPEKKDPSEVSSETDLCSRVGTLVVHSFGSIETEADGFHSENYITPPGYVSSRIFWSTRRPRTRTAYILKVERGLNGQAEFSIIPGDDPTAKITSTSPGLAYASLMERVKKVNTDYFSHGNMFSKLPMVRRTRRKTFGLNGPQFFGFGLDHIRRILESMPGVEAVAAALTTTSPQYKFCFSYGPGASDPAPLIELIRVLQRKRAARKAEQASQNSSGCARTEGIKAVVTSGGSGRITRALVRSAEEADTDSGVKKSEDKAVADRNVVQVKYRQMNAIPIDQRLVARRSHIHGWGLFTKRDVAKHYPVVEYMGEIIRQRVADVREKAYELSGEGSCYMFRLDLNRIVDATKIGCMARFMNHSCQPNAYAKIVSVDTEQGTDKKIVVFANRDISAGEEITYDYKFPVEDGSLKCTCGAPNCIGRLN